MIVLLDTNVVSELIRQGARSLSNVDNIRPL